MHDDTASAPATRCSVSVRQGGRRVAFMELDPSTTLRECLQQLPSDVDAPALVDNKWHGPLPRDGSSCGAAVPLRPDQINETLQALGWFPSGVLELGDAPVAERPTATPSVPPSALFAAVASRHDAADALTGNGISGKIRTSQADAAEDAKRDAKTANLVWQMMAKRHASGRSTLREEDRVYLVLERPDRAARYCFFSAQDTWGRARDALGSNGALARSDGATASANDTLGALRARGWLENFAVVRFVDSASTAAPVAPAAPPAAAPPSPGAAAPIDNPPVPPAPPSDAYVVSFVSLRRPGAFSTAAHRPLGSSEPTSSTQQSARWRGRPPPRHRRAASPVASRAGGQGAPHRRRGDGRRIARRGREGLRPRDVPAGLQGRPHEGPLSRTIKNEAATGREVPRHES